MAEAEFLFDFGSPNAWCAHKLIPEIEARTGVTFRYTPILLGGLFKLTGNQAPMLAFASVPNKLQYEMLELRRFLAKHQLAQFQMNPHFPVNTLLLMRMATAAKLDGALPAFVDAAFRFMWEEPRKMDDREVAVAALNEAGLDGAALAARAQASEVKAALVAATEDAARRGAFGSPSFFIDGELYFGKNTLPEIEERLAG